MAAEQPPSSNGSGRPGWLKRLSQALGAEPRDRDTLIEILEAAHQRGLYDVDALGMIQGVLDVADTQARDIMIPRPHMVVVERDARAQELLPIIIDSGHSRFPVIGEDRDEVIGILLAKDLLRFFAEAEDVAFNIREYLRAPVFIPESKRLNVLLKEFRDSQNHMAIVVDEYGGVSGLVTIEDVIEQIVGDIDDEHDVEEEDISSEGDDRWSVRALTRIEDFNEHFKTGFDDEHYDTIGGLVIHAIGRLPRRGDSVVVSGWRFRVTRATRRRIDTLQVQQAITSERGDIVAAEIPGGEGEGSR
ncbi:MAG: transporter associated domain-containing protein [Pseudomonadota bacterium]